MALVVSCMALAVPATAEQKSSATMQGLDEQVQEIKSDVLRIAAELGQLEEMLLYPSDTQVAVFVSLAEGDKSQIDSVRIQIDGEVVAHHIYSWKELEAMRKGGVQRIYTGNLPVGRHRVDVSVAGKGKVGRDWSGEESFEVEKGVEPELVSITLGASDLGGARIELAGR